MLYGMGESHEMVSPYIGSSFFRLSTLITKVLQEREKYTSAPFLFMTTSSKERPLIKEQEQMKAKHGSAGRRDER